MNIIEEDLTAIGVVVVLCLGLGVLCWRAFEREPGPCVDGMRDVCLDIFLCLREVKEPCESGP